MLNPVFKSLFAARIFMKIEHKRMHPEHIIEGASLCAIQ